MRPGQVNAEFKKKQLLLEGLSKQFKRTRRALRVLKTRVGRVHREIERKLDQLPAAVQDKARDLLERVRRILIQQTKDKHKL